MPSQPQPEVQPTDEPTNIESKLVDAIDACTIASIKPPLALADKLAQWEALEQHLHANTADELIVSLDVGGTLFRASKEHLLRFKDSYFHALLESGHWHPNGSNQTYTVDMEPTHFWRVLRFMRTGELTFEGLDDEATYDLQAMLDYLNMDIPGDTHASKFVVSGAGFSPVNGVYSVEDNNYFDECCIYSMVSPVDGVEYTLFRVMLPSKNRRWYISLVVDRRLIGTLSDMDFYFRVCTTVDYVPPRDEWKAWPKNSAAIAPIPTVCPVAWSINTAQPTRTTKASPGTSNGLRDAQDALNQCHGTCSDPSG
ncbi:Aste57867_17807 [Aphanomyces stellatus]|uniref:Aste57867_17807 protein n=1 Tax=Aphanomyces stellatus TaxID=120398 RepID=A0A485LC60_9STRA|nr:hypothetical protein As57867_017746 [Aphanomyces stellatus]VFT94551.1 Aste57867_17807 [Aphanomyces stellatus]